ncbi:MAG: hypothetical protein IJT69_00040 [Clostridia bacterium]|nr:hypothetical protein [Clostridia bacterium]
MRKEIDKKESDALAAEVRADFEKRRDARKSLEMQWRLNLNYFMGNQYCEIGQNGDIEDYGKQYFWQQREVYNHTATVLETRISKLSAIKVGMSVRPLTSDETDKSAAAFSTKILASVFNEINPQKLINEANMWSEVTGTALYKIVWDKDKGRRIGRIEEGDVYDGDVSVEVIPPFEIYPDSVTNMQVDDCRSLIHAKAYPTSLIRDKWGVEVAGEDICGFSVTGGSTIGGLGYSGFVQGMAEADLTDHAMVLERYEAPSGERPNGRLVIVAGNAVVFDGDLPYVNKEEGRRGFPFAKQVAIVCPGNFFGTSIVERMIPIQRAFNAVKNRKHEYLNRMTMGVLAVEDGSVDVENLEEDGLSPGKVLIVRQGGRMPQMLEIGSVPVELIREEERLLDEFTLISGVSDLMKYSQAPTTNSSGKAIALLMEQDESRLKMTATEIRSAIKEVAKQVLRLYKQFALASRMKRVSGDNGEIEMKYFDRNDLSSDDVVYDVSGDILETAASRRSTVIDLLNLGLLTDDDGKMNAANKTKVLEMLGFGNWESARELDVLNQNRAKEENERVRTERIDPEEVDDDEIHIAEHSKALLGKEYDYSPEAKERLLEHVRLHKRRKALLKSIDQGAGAQ